MATFSFIKHLEEAFSIELLKYPVLDFPFSPFYLNLNKRYFKPSSINLHKDKELKNIIRLLINFYKDKLRLIPVDYVLPYLYFFSNGRIERRVITKERSLIVPSQFNLITEVHTLRYNNTIKSFEIKRHLKNSYELLENTEALDWYTTKERNNQYIMYKLVSKI